MVGVTKRSSSKQLQVGGTSGTSTYIIFAVKILLVLVILFLLPKLVIAGNPSSRGRKKKHEFEVRTLRSNCASQTCASFIAEEGMNCLLACVSPSCFERVYGLSPLEDGEVDVDRANAFETCLKEELRVLRQRKKSRLIK